MKISYNWVKQFINTSWTAEDTGDLLTDLGLEVEGIEHYQSIKGALKGVVVGEVLTCVQHPNADRLKVTTVKIDDNDPVQIVCGAPNVAAGQKVPVATIGTTLYTDTSESWTIKKGKIRGEESFGMICAEDELGLGKSHDGIMVLPNDTKIGTPCAELFEIVDDIVFEIGLTPNRADAMSHMGVARDLKAGLQQKDITLEFMSPSVSTFHVDTRTLKVSVDVLNKELAPRYCGVTISNLKVKDSPQWLQHKLKAIGLSPINNVVDATNYVLHELGQPLHAFDSDKISGNKIEVKTLEKGTKFITLDGVERELHEDDLMICDAEKPMCIAGVFGGLNSGVTNETSSIFLESAYFNPVSIRKTAKRHGLNTDASFRFERGIDPKITEYALKRAAILIKELAEGEITSDIIDINYDKIEDAQVRISYDNITKLIGQEIPHNTIKNILTSLDIKINNATETGLGLTIPSYRNDVTREVDIIEDILRVYGYNNINIPNKMNATISNSSKFENHKLITTIGDQLVSQGFYEIMTNSLTNPKYNELSTTLNDDNDVKIMNHLSSELSVLRQTMLFTGLESISYNINRKKNSLKFFEFGNSYTINNEKYNEQKHLALFLTGSKTTETWVNGSETTGFYNLKGYVVSVLNRLGIQKFSEEALENSNFDEGLSFNQGKTSLVEFGLVSKNILKGFSISQPVYFADFNWQKIIELVKRNTFKLKPISKYPEVRRDFALLVDNSVTFKSINAIASKTERKFLKSVNLFDVYQGNKLPAGKKSYAVSFMLQDEESTLTDKKIDGIMKRLQDALQKELNAELR